MNKILKIISILLLISLVVGFIFFVIRFIATKNRAEILATKAELLSLEKEALIQEKQQEENLVLLLKKELAGLADVKNIKDQYAANEIKLKSLDETYAQVKQEKDSLLQSNLTLNSRVNSLTREFTQTLETLKNVKQELNAVKSDKTIQGYIEKIEQTGALLKEKDKEIKKLLQENTNSNKDKSALEKKISKMESDQKKLESKLAQALKAAEQTPDDKVKAQIIDLRNQLKDKELQRSLLNKEVVTYASASTNMNEKIKQQSERIASLEQELIDIQRKTRNIKKIEAERDQAEAELASAEQKLKEQEKLIANFKKDSSVGILATGEVPLRSGETNVDLNRAYALYDTAKAQVVKFSELLMSKEVELETSKQRISELENTLKGGSGLSFPEGATEARQYALLKDRIKMLNESLSDKEGVIKRKDEELAELARQKQSLEERGLYQDKEFNNANTLYSSLKSQMLQMSDILSRREEEIIAKNKDILSLKSELAILRAEFQVKQQELLDIQQNQKRMMDDLSRSTQLNISLQENMADRFKRQENDSEDKIKADKLKKEIELLMGN